MSEKTLSSFYISFTDFSGAFSIRFVQTVSVAAIPVSFSTHDKDRLAK